MDKEKTDILNKSVTSSRMDDVLDAGKRMLDDAKNEEPAMQSTQPKEDGKAES